MGSFAPLWLNRGKERAWIVSKGIFEYYYVHNYSVVCYQLNVSHQFSVRWVRRGEALQILIFGGPIDSVNLVPRAFAFKKMGER